MKRILRFFLSLLYFSTANAQVEKTITVPYTTSASPTYQALLYLPSDYTTSTKSYPLLVFLHSASEAADGASAGTGLAKIYNQSLYGGPAYFIEHSGWPASFTNPVTGAQEQFIVVSPQASDWSTSGDQLANMINFLVTAYRVDVNRIHLTGVSAGGAGVVEYAAQMNVNQSAPNINTDIRKYKPADIVAMSEATNASAQSWANVIVADSIPDWGFGDPKNDLYGGVAMDLTSFMNKVKSGYARFTSFSTGHGPWNPFYNPTYTQNFAWKGITTNYSIYTWMLGNSRIPVPVVPVANAGTAQAITLPASQATLSGSASTGTITSYTWSQISGPNTATITTPTTVGTTVTGLVQGTYVFQLLVTGGSTATVQVTVNPVPPPPVANAGAAQTINLPTATVTLSGSASTGTISSYAWSQVSGPNSATLATPTTVSTKITGLIQGVYVFQLLVTGGSTATVQVTVKPAPLQANAGSAQTITLPTNHVTLNASASTGAIATYAWTELIGPVSDTIKSPASSSTSVTGMVAGTYTFQLKLTDNTGAISTSTVDVLVLSNATYASPVASIATASQTVTLPTAIANETVNFTLTGSSLNTVKWTKFKTPGQTTKTVVFLGSSTTAGIGASVTDSSYVGRFTKYYTAQGMISRVVNLSVSGYNPYNAMPTGYVAPASVVNALGASAAAVDQTVNVTKALTFNPDIVVINFPNNGYDVLSAADIMNGLQLLYNAATANGAECYVSTTQPREDFTSAIQSFLQVMRDSILLRFGTHAMDFYDPVVVPGTTKRLYPSSADNIHENDQGHRQLFDVVVGTNIFQNKINSASVIASPGSATTAVTGLTAGANLFQATVVDGHGQNISAVAAVTVNQPANPVANAGSPQTIILPVNQVILNGSGSTGFITSYAWSQLSGPDINTIVSPSSVSTSVTGLVEGVYVFQLTLNGDSVATVQVTVKVPPPPIADAGPPQTIMLPQNQVILSGSASSGTITSYGWTQLSGPETDTIVSPSGDSTKITGLVEGVYVFQLTLNGDSVSTVQVSVKVPPLVANAGPDQTIALPTNQVTLSGSASSGIINSYSWTQLSGPATAIILSASADSTQVTGLTEGTYVFQLTLNGDSLSTVQVTVIQPPVVANAGASQTINLPANQVTLDGDASSGIIVSYAWTQVSGPANDTIVTPLTSGTIVKGLELGVYTFQLTVTDNLNTVRTDTMTVTVNSGVITKLINVNVYGGTNPYANTAWNNWNVNNGVNSPTLTYADASSSGVTAALSINESVADNGATYGGTMAPPAVLRYTSFCETNRTLIFSGLKAAATYNIELYASRNSNSGQLSVFQITGQKSDTISSFNNLTNKAVFSGLKATSGKLTITIATPTGYNYLNGFVLTELTSTSGTTGGTSSQAFSGSPAAIFDDSTAGAEGKELVIYPNPATDRFTLNINNGYTGAMKVTIVDRSGAILQVYESAKNQQTSSVSLPVSKLAAGVYFITVQVGGWKETRKLLKR